MKPDYTSVIWRRPTAQPEAYIVVIDLNRGAISVTNAAEKVVAAVLQEHGALPIVYRDSEGDWAVLATRFGKFAGFGDIENRLGADLRRAFP